MNGIYQPRGMAKEYGDYAINIYTGCPHGCYYCFAPSVLRKDREIFHSCVEPRKGIVDAVHWQLEREDYFGETIHLCFTCDPYPVGIDTSITRNIIEDIKEHGGHVQILTKSRETRDFDLLDAEDWFGITLTGATKEQEPFADRPIDRLHALSTAKIAGINTWVSFEPVVNAEWVFDCIEKYGYLMDKIKIGKLNYHPSDINWKEFGNKVEKLCKGGFNYTIKDGLRKEMDK